MLEMAAGCGFLKVWGITVAINETKVLVNASGHAAATVETVRVDGTTPPPRVLAALGREGHGRSVRHLEQRDDPAEPPSDAPFVERMAHQLATSAGRARYKLRQQTVGPTFGTIKEAIGFRPISLRAKKEVPTEWALVCLAYNFRRLHRLTVARMAQDAEN